MSRGAHVSEDELIERLAGHVIAAVPDFDQAEQALALALLRALANGAPVSEETLAAASGTSEQTVRDALASRTSSLR